MKGRMNSDLDTLRAMSPARFVVYFAFVGCVSGLLAWMLVFGGHILFEISRPTLTSLLWAIPRGGLFAVVLGLVFPFHIETHVTNRPETITVTVESVEFNPEIDDSRFRFPG